MYTCMCTHMAYFLSRSIVIPSKHTVYREKPMVYGSGEKGELVLYFFTINIFKKLKRPNILESREVHKTRIKYGYGEQQKRVYMYMYWNLVHIQIVR